jgi:AcrR family transcriptional regulator
MIVQLWNSLLPFAVPDALKPRKSPRQARSATTMGAIFEATIQVLLAEGERGLTTTRVAERAGVSVGTMYQYFPHKQALLYAVLQSHLTHVADKVEAACQSGRGQATSQLADVLVGAFLDAKVEKLDAAKALYLIAEDLDTTTLFLAAIDRNIRSASTLFASAADANFEDLEAVAATVFSSVAGSTRIAFGRGASASALLDLRRELTLMCRSYLEVRHRPRR